MAWIRGVVVIITLCLTGFFYRIHKLNEVQNRQNFAQTYRQKFIDFSNNLNDQKVINWLHFNSNRMQNDTGSLGVMDYSPPGSSYMIRNYAVFLNMIGEILQHIDLNRGSGIYNDSISYNLRTMDEILLRYLGLLEELIAEHRKQLRNPVLMLADGIRFYVRLPLLILYWAGVVSSNSYSNALANPFLKLSGWIIAILGVFGTLVTIVTGWSTFLTDMHQWISAL